MARRYRPRASSAPRANRSAGGYGREPHAEVIMLVHRCEITKLKSFGRNQRSGYDALLSAKRTASLLTASAFVFQ